MKPKILVASADADLVAGLGAALSERDVDLITVRDEGTAIFKTRAVMPELLLVDAGLSTPLGHDCYFVAGVLRLLDEQVPILLLCSERHPFDPDQARTSGVDGWLTIPPGPEDVKRAFELIDQGRPGLKGRLGELRPEERRPGGESAEGAWLTCPQCGAPIEPTDQRSTSCPTCRAEVLVPGAVAIPMRRGASLAERRRIAARHAREHTWGLIATVSAFVLPPLVALHFVAIPLAREASPTLGTLVTALTILADITCAAVLWRYIPKRG